jgi:hypothetical protein
MISIAWRQSLGQRRASAIMEKGRDEFYLSCRFCGASTRASHGRIRETLGLTFRPPVVRNLTRVRQRSYGGPVSLRFTYSIEGPVHIELIEGSAEGPPESIWAPSDGLLHHIGMWSENPLVQSKQMEAGGFEWEGSIYADDGAVRVIFVRKKNVRVELMVVSRRDVVLDWLAGKRDTP